jgi:putative ABC transport system ATP-binding protein
MFVIKNIRYKDILEIDYLSIEKNKITCIVGESGSGKTTLLRLLNKMISCESGEIFYNGENIDTVDSVEIRRQITMLPQVPTVFPGTIRENLLIGLKFAEKPMVDDEKLHEILATVNLEKYPDTESDDLSGGEKQRLALGRVILLDPEVFLLDEPSSALDDETEKIVIEKIVSYTKATDKTLIMVTHSKSIAREYSEKIIEISKGRIVSPKEVFV